MVVTQLILPHCKLQLLGAFNITLSTLPVCIASSGICFAPVLAYFALALHYTYNMFINIL
jgi:hypothetical protein